jgi:PAS domain S-box-containing protein
MSMEKENDLLPARPPSNRLPFENARASFFKSVLDAIPEFIVYYDDKLNVVWANRAASEDAGMAREEFIGRNLFEAACKLDEPCEDCPVVKGLSSESVEVVESNIHLGRLFYTRCYPVKGNGGNLPGRLLLAQDVSRLRNRYSVTEILNLIFEVFHTPHSLAGICRQIVHMVAERFDYPVGCIALFDHGSTKITSMAEVDLSGKSRTVSEALALPVGLLWSPLRGGRVVNETGLSGMQSPGSSARGGERAQTVLGVPLKVDGAVSGAIILVDFKERLESSLMVDGLQAVANRLGAEIHRKQTEKRLREEQSFTEAVLNNAGPLIMVLDRDGRVVRFNKACERLTGYGYEEVAGRSIFEFLVDSRESGPVRDIFPLSAHKTPPSSFEGHWIGRDGEKRLISWSNSLMRDAEEGNIHIVSIGVDITDRRKAEEEADLRRRQLLQADKMASLGVLASGIAHEVNNPNNFIMMNSPILKQAWRDISPVLEKYYAECGDFALAGMSYAEMRDEVPRLFEGIEAGSERIEKIVATMKNYAKRDAPEIPRPLDMNEVVAAAISLLSHEIKKSTRHLNIEPGEDCVVKGVFQRLEQVVVNLIQNACHSLIDCDKNISIRTFKDRRKREVVLSIVDEGVGIKPEHMNRLFEPFFTTKADAGGTGLGLSVCASIVKEHNGRLQFDSKPGEGTEVRLALPAAGKEKGR